jgi:hypothetical protein
MNLISRQYKQFYRTTKQQLNPRGYLNQKYLVQLLNKNLKGLLSKSPRRRNPKNRTLRQVFLIKGFRNNLRLTLQNLQNEL